MHSFLKIGDLIENNKAHSQTGPFGTQLKASEYVEDGFPVINVRNIGLGDIRKENLEYIDEKKAKELKSHSLLENDIVFGRKGAVERHSFVTSKETGWIQGSDCIRLRFLTEEINPKFISYFFRTNMHQQWMINLGSFGATMGSLNQEIISKIEIPDLSRDLQDDIASILSAYDDLIENNNQRIKLLEETTEEIYKEWFIRFRFPGYENSIFIDKDGKEVPYGTRGAIPGNWEGVRVEDLLDDIGRGPSLNYDIPRGEGKPVLNQSCVRNGIIELQKILYAEDLNKNKSNCYLKKNDVLINSMGDGTLGRVSRNVQFASNEFIIHNCITYLRASDNYSQFALYYLIKQYTPYYISIAQGSTGQSTLKKELVGRIKTLKPCKNVLNSFDAVIKTMWEEIGLLKNKNETLHKMRDLILPRLISGKLSVENLETESLNLAAQLQ